MGGEDTSRLITPRDRCPYGSFQPPRYASLERERRTYSEPDFTRGRPSGGIYERERRPYAHDLSPRGTVFTGRERRPYRQGPSVRDPPRRGGGGYGGRGYGGNGYHGSHGGGGGHGYGGGDYIRISHFRAWW